MPAVASVALIVATAAGGAAYPTGCDVVDYEDITNHRKKCKDVPVDGRACKVFISKANKIQYCGLPGTTGRPWAECGHYTPQWWGVDLGSEMYVGYVRLQNRNDCCPERLTDVDIYLGPTAGTFTGNALVKSDVSVLSNVMLEVEINALGRYIYVNRPSATGLTVCKFYVFAS
ncbi:hypothetical protein EMIHUDRAFT_248890 [Emiliania huxleyi CCMP1516]|uniref:Fucolectin tachylectin-4 pentraxin-1 domain-containing protein n=2 Tax=Emiliania huxleyi TaxID=2903 RepID=A0A0D3ICC3_EMIH1|nr:hypothetical protein EMIHUDRAFT_248890 [Emiliania huxleyi CCMP1516]EOD08908.1 hypothetical protein EMIHUDRAFT_248890 [Emiliania huxleyi CCMP1516]|eukprot:XP_005761337.1 hypothetical protein EMIHUDRAFT_248890 [Emiliania huxleyi CCMP1516]